MRNVMKALGAAGLVATCVAAQAQTVTIDSGKLAGQAADGVLAFKGIPYAQPPVGALRWRAPQPVPVWAGVRAATTYGPDCAQHPFVGDAAPLGVTPAEDCLYLNVWRPAATAGQPLPVMVWLHGGGFVNGGSSPAIYDGTGFAKRGVILVSLNYRLGRFGFFAHPALRGADDLAGNYGYMDQLAALRWVQRNIRAFGGDPRNVTLFGESAGGASVLAMMTTPLAQGLFQKAIVESGGGRGALMPMRDLREDQPKLASAESVGVAFATSAGIAPGDPDALAKLRALPAERVVDGMDMGSMFNPTYTGGPVRDGKIVIDTPDAIIRRGANLKVPLIIGATSADLGGDRVMIEPARMVARLASAQGTPAYVYRFSYVATALRADTPGAPHATELPYVFDTVRARYGDQATPADIAAAQAPIAYWVAFAKTGNPNTAGLPRWEPITAHGDALLDFTHTGPVAGPDPWKARLDAAEADAKQGVKM